MFPAALHFQHHVWESAGAVDSHNNPVGVLGEAIDRVAIAWFPITSSEPISPDFVARTVTDVAILVEDPSLFNAKDAVVLGGVTYEVIGVPADWSQGPWWAGVGGEIHARRVD